MPWCSICRREYSGQEGTACPRCAASPEAEPSAIVKSDPEPQVAPEQQAAEPQTTSGQSPPAHLAILEQAAQGAAGASTQDAAAVEAAKDRSPKRRLVSSAGPSVPIRKQANDSVPSSWMSRLEAARLVTTSDREKDKEKDRAAASAAAAEKAQKPGQPPPLKSAANKEEKKSAQVGKPTHLLVAQLEAEDKKRTDEEAIRVSALFAGDRSDEIAKVELALSTDEVRKKKIPNWVVVLVLAVLVVAAVGTVVMMAHKEPGPSAEVDPAVQAAIEKRKQAIIALEEGHRLAIEGKTKADDAIKAYSRALELDPLLTSAERGLAISYAAKEDEQGAVEHYKSYLKLSPQATDADTVRKIVSDYEKKKAGKKAAEPPNEEPKHESFPASKMKNGKHRHGH